MFAYDLEILHQPAARGTVDNQGWVFGLPPGISEAQWPLDPVTGYPLMHGFTLLLPPDYRIHGPEIVALSFFATAADQNDGGAGGDEALAEAVRAEHDVPPSDPTLRPFWTAGRQAHPRLSRMTDILDYAYAVILLTQAEFDGPLCLPPAPMQNHWLDAAPAPRWLTMGSARAFWSADCDATDRPLEDRPVWRILGELPQAALDYHRAIRCTPRASDPNAGKIPCEPWEAEPGGYMPPYSSTEDADGTTVYGEHPWAHGHRPNHIGGTMRPVQGVPSMSPYYIGFEEYFGGYNFGSGNAQLDVKSMEFDWAC